MKPNRWHSFSLREVMALAGSANYLDTVPPESDPNEKDGAAYQHGPVGRICGGEITAHLQCTNKLWRIARELNLEGPVCYLEFEFTQKGWTWLEDLVPVGIGSVRYRKSHGIRLRFQPAGQFHYVNLKAIILYFTSGLILLSLPMKFTLFILRHGDCLFGLLGRMYKRVIFEKFDLRDAIAGMAIRLVAGSVSFVELEDEAHKDGMQCSGIIPKVRITEQLSEVLRRRGAELDADQANELINFCHAQAVRAGDRDERDRKTGHRQWRDFQTEILGRGRSTVSQGEGLDIDNFSLVHSNVDQVSFPDVVRLFNRDRRLGWLENFFMPSYLKEVVNPKKETPTENHSESVNGIGVTATAELESQKRHDVDEGSKSIAEQRLDRDLDTSTSGRTAFVQMNSSIRQRRRTWRKLGDAVQVLLDTVGKSDERIKEISRENDALREHLANMRNELENKQSSGVVQAKALASNLTGLTTVLDERVASIEDNLRSSNEHLWQDVCDLHHKLELMQEQGSVVPSGASSVSDPSPGGAALDALKRALDNRIEWYE